MTIACRPSLVYPPHVVSQNEILNYVANRHSEHPQLHTILSLMRNTNVRTRATAVPFDEVTRRPHTFGARNATYLTIAQNLGLTASKQALLNADTGPEEVDLLIVVSCTGFVMPGLDAHLAGALGLRRNVRRLPVSQMGCAGGAYAFARAKDFAAGHPESTVLLVAVELCSLSYQPDDVDLASFVSLAQFGDAAASCVVRPDRPGLRLDSVFDDLAPDSLRHSAYEVDEWGFHFRTNPRSSRLVAELMPLVAKWLEETEGAPAWQPDFVLSHTGGPRIMREVSKGLGIPERMFGRSERTLVEGGNTASTVLFDILAQTFDKPPRPDDRGFMIAFGPGVTTAALTTTWQNAEDPINWP